jgi:hypothetical protein
MCGSAHSISIRSSTSYVSRDTWESVAQLVAQFVEQLMS